MVEKCLLAITWVGVSLAVIGSAACTTVRRAACEAEHCGPSDCEERGRVALEEGRPDVAECLLRNAVELNRSDENARVRYGTCLVIMGKLGAAREQFQWVIEKSHDEVAKAVARDWLQRMAAPLSLAIFYRPDSGCGVDGVAGQKAGGSLRRTLTLSGVFRAVTTDAESPVKQGGEGDACVLAERRGAQVALIVGVRCNRLAAIQEPEVLGGRGQTKNATRYTSTILLNVEAYQVRKRERRFSVAAAGSASHLLPRAAVWTAMDVGVSRVVLRLVKLLLYGAS
jgi:hypothetical protein